MSRVDTPMVSADDHLLLASKFRGALLGCFIGDALGRPFEGSKAGDASIVRALARRVSAPGTWSYSDDTEMMIGVAESVVRCGGVDARDLLHTMATHCDPARGYGRGVRITFDAFLRKKGRQPAAFVAWREGSWGNGASVRVVPIACLSHDDLATLEAMAEESAGVTHAHPIGRVGCVLQALALDEALRVHPEKGIDPEAFLLDLSVRMSARPQRYSEKLRAAARLVRTRPPPREVASLLGNGVSAEDSVPLAIYLFATRFPKVDDVVLSAVEHGGDTDTIAAMSGALVGAACGADAIPQEWLARLENGPRGRDHVIGLAEGLCGLRRSLCGGGAPLR